MGSYPSPPHLHPVTSREGSLLTSMMKEHISRLATNCKDDDDVHYHDFATMLWCLSFGIKIPSWLPPISNSLQFPLIVPLNNEDFIIGDYSTTP